MSKLDKDQVVADFTAAYKAVNGKEPQIEAKGGWYSIDGGKNVRLAAIVDLTAELSGGSSEAKVEEKPAKAAPKKAAKKAVAAPKEKSLGYTVVKKGDGYGPANFWLDYLASLGSDSRTPHGFY
jgi:hypothetical protein